MHEKLISNLKNVRFSGKGRQSLTYTCKCYENKMLISCIKLDHVLYSINDNSSDVTGYVRTSPVDDPSLLDRLLEDTECIMEGAIRLIQDLLGGSSDNNSARLTQRNSGETKKLHTFII